MRFELFHEFEYIFTEYMSSWTRAKIRAYEYLNEPSSSKPLLDSVWLVYNPTCKSYQIDPKWQDIQISFNVFMCTDRGIYSSRIRGWHNLSSSLGIIIRKSFWKVCCNNGSSSHMLLSWCWRGRSFGYLWGLVLDQTTESEESGRPIIYPVMSLRYLSSYFKFKLKSSQLSLYKRDWSSDI